MAPQDERSSNDYEWKHSVDQRLGALLAGQVASTAERGELRARLDHLVLNIEGMIASVSALNEILAVGRGSMALLFLLAKLAVAVGAISAAVYALKAWILK